MSWFSEAMRCIKVRPTNELHYGRLTQGADSRSNAYRRILCDTWRPVNCGRKTNPTEIEFAVRALVATPFDRTSFPYDLIGIITRQKALLVSLGAVRQILRNLTTMSYGRSISIFGAPPQGMTSRRSQTTSQTMHLQRNTIRASYLSQTASMCTFGTGSSATPVTRTSIILTNRQIFYCRWRGSRGAQQPLRIQQTSRPQRG
jgi:hypothetical protein